MGSEPPRPTAPSCCVNSLHKRRSTRLWGEVQNEVEEEQEEEEDGVNEHISASSKGLWWLNSIERGRFELVETRRAVKARLPPAGRQRTPRSLTLL
ncbi:unnamed protein product [Camellia sinensis]